MILKNITKNLRIGLRVLSNPERAFSELKNYSFEDVVSYYMIMLVLTSFVAGIVNFLVSIIKNVYFDIFINVDVKYLAMLNYTLSVSASLMFLYIFVGIFILFFISILLIPFFHKIKYIDLLKILLYSMSPFLVFVWVPFSYFPLLIWSIFLLVTGIKSHKIVKIKSNSIKQRY